MAGEEQGSPYPLPKFRFSVGIPGLGEDLPFQNVGAIETETQAIEYRSGNAKSFAMLKMPGMVTNGNVTLSKGVFTRDNKLFDWYNSIKMNTIERKTITIKALDENGDPTVVFTLKNAWPTKITGAEFNAQANEIAVESVEIAHEGVTVENG